MSINCYNYAASPNIPHYDLNFSDLRQGLGFPITQAAIAKQGERLFFSDPKNLLLSIQVEKMLAKCAGADSSSEKIIEEFWKEPTNEVQYISLARSFSQQFEAFVCRSREEYRFSQMPLSNQIQTFQTSLKDWADRHILIESSQAAPAVREYFVLMHEICYKERIWEEVASFGKFIYEAQSSLLQLKNSRVLIPKRRRTDAIPPCSSFHPLLVALRDSREKLSNHQCTTGEEYANFYKLEQEQLLELLKKSEPDLQQNKRGPHGG